MSVNPTYNPLNRRSMKFTEDVGRFKFVGYDGKKTGDGELAAGVTEHSFNNGDDGSVITAGTALMMIKAQLTAGTLLKSDLVGDAIAAVQTGDFVLAVLPQDASANTLAEIELAKFKL